MDQRSLRRYRRRCALLQPAGRQRGGNPGQRMAFFFAFIRWRTCDPGDPGGGGRGGERDGDLLGRPARDAALHPRVRVRQVHRVAPLSDRHRHRPRRPGQRRRRLGGNRGGRYRRRRRKQQQQQPRQRAPTHRCCGVPSHSPPTRRRVGLAERYGTLREFKEFIGNGNVWIGRRSGTEDGRRCRGGGPRPPQFAQGPPNTKGSREGERSERRTGGEKASGRERAGSCGPARRSMWCYVADSCLGYAYSTCSSFELFFLWPEKEKRG